MSQFRTNSIETENLYITKTSTAQLANIMFYKTELICYFSQKSDPIIVIKYLLHAV